MPLQDYPAEDPVHRPSSNHLTRELDGKFSQQNYDKAYMSDDDVTLTGYRDTLETNPNIQSDR